MIKFFILLLSIPSLLFAQISDRMGVAYKQQGIKFERGLSWEKILAKAKLDGKSIFVDCYTTWCGPCKRMDQEVYTLDKVGRFFNDKFISVKFQMDTSKLDDNEVRLSYGDASFIMKQYDIKAFPTFLFFNPNGQIVERSAGAMTANDFIAFAQTARDSTKDYYTLFIEFKNGVIQMPDMVFLARQALKFGDTLRSVEVSKAYIAKLKRSDWFDKDNIIFMQEFTKSSSDFGFNLFYHNADKINKVMSNESYAEGLLHYIIYKELVMPEIENSDLISLRPDWNALFLKVQRKYNTYYAQRVIMASRYSWARRHKNWDEYIKYYVQYIEKYSPIKGNIIPENNMEDFLWNNRAWEIFKYSNKKEDLAKALVWSKYAVLMNPMADWIDTYANILYKMGYYDAALNWQNVAIKIDPENPGIKANLNKMKINEPTWE